MNTAVIIDAVRTPIGRRNGTLRHWHPVDLAASMLDALIARNDIEPTMVDDVVMGCVMQVGEQSTNIARNAVLAAGWPETVPGTTIDRQCGSGQQAVHFAAQAVMAGVQDVVVAAGVEVMTRVPMGAPMLDGKYGYPFGPSIGARYADGGGFVPQGVSAELIAAEWGIGRSELDEYSCTSQQRAAVATAERRFEREIVPIEGAFGRVVDYDEGVRDTSVDELGLLPAAFVPDGVITAGNSCQVSDGAAAVLVMSEQRAADLGLTPRARFVDFVVAGDNPRMMLTAPIPATRAILERNSMRIDDVDLVEINEAFASVVLAWARELDPDLDRVNVNGGAIALGHPLGSSGARLLATLVCELERRGGGLGLQTMCEGGGMANALLVETY